MTLQLMSLMKRHAAGALVASIVVLMLCQSLFHEPFDSLERWTESRAREDYGKLKLSSGRFFGDEKINRGAMTSQDARFYAASTPVGEIANDGKELVVSLSVKHDQDLDCGGGYMKLLGDMDQASFYGETPYIFMFGPDKCGMERRVHIIYNYKGVNKEWKKKVEYPDDRLTHVYTLRWKPTNEFELYIDQELKESGSLEDGWDLLEPKMIKDETDKKPEDWVDDATMEDPDDKKPADWDSEPERIRDATAKKPEDWDDAEDGDWEAPMIPNPAYKGEWAPRRIANPAYKGEWSAREIPNPNYVVDKELYRLRQPIKYCGIDVWQVKSGTIFDNIVIGDNLDEVNEIIKKTWGATKDAEKLADEAYRAKDKESAESAKTESEIPSDAKDDL